MLAEERRVVSVLICDLVGSTAHTARADAELVDPVLRAFSELAHEIVLAHGGVTEKSVGDAVMAVFGAPFSHDDDGVRAVAASLDLLHRAGGLSWPDGEPLAVHAGIATGEALVRLTADPSAGEGYVFGEVANRASRLQRAAPPGAVLVDRQGYETSCLAVEFEQWEPVVVDAESPAAEAWRAVRLARTGGAWTPSAPFVGRAPELSRLDAALEAALASRQGGFVFVVGEPGIGKSRLLAQWRGALGEKTAPRWFEGKCRPFGFGTALSALGDIVRAATGITVYDATDDAVRKLDEAVAEGADADWLRERLRPLVGLPAAPAPREELFAAWRAYLGEVAARGPVILLLEDLHLADDTTLAFVAGLAADPVPGQMLVVVSARPEALDRGEAFVGAGTELVELQPLSDVEARTLIVALLGPAHPRDLSLVLTRSGGNPLFVETYTRLLSERGTPASGTAFDDDPSRVPGTIHAVIAARLDTLTPDDRALLQDAAVVGEAFWEGALGRLGRRSEEEVGDGLSRLAARRLIRESAGTRLPGQREHVFSHGLVVDVAYGQIPHRTRTVKHRAAGEWLSGSEFVGLHEFVEARAHHFATACELARSVRDDALAATLLAPTLRSLTEAAEEALSRDMATALRHLDRALALAPPEGSEYPWLLQARGLALVGQARHREAAETLAQAVAAAKAAGQPRVAAIADSYLCASLAYLAEPGHYEAIVDACEVVRDDGPSIERVQALWTYAGYHCNVLADWHEAQRAAGESLAMAEDLGAGPPMGALAYRGYARCRLGDAGGVEDIEQALEHGVDSGFGEETVCRALNLDALCWTRGPAGALESLQPQAEAARRRGLDVLSLDIRSQCVAYLAAAGRWDEALAEVAALETVFTAAGSQWNLIPLCMHGAAIEARRGEADGALRRASWLAQVGADMPIQPTRSFCLLTAAAVHGLVGEPVQAERLFAQWLEGWDGLDPSHVDLVGDVVRSVPGAAVTEWAARPLGQVGTGLAVYRNIGLSAAAAAAERRGDPATEGHAAAALAWREFGVPYEEAQASLGCGRCLLALGRGGEADGWLTRALGLFANLGVETAVGEAKGLQRRARAAVH